MTAAVPPPQDRPPEQDRLLVFSDGVFAIAITLLVIDLKLPADTHDLRHALWELGPKLLSYLLSFLVIYRFWLSHQRVFRSIVAVDAALVWLNGLFLLGIAFLPFPVAVLGDHSADAFAVALYALTMTATSLLLAAIMWYAARHPSLVSADRSPADARATLVRSLTLAGVFLASVPLAFLSARTAEASWTLAFLTPLAVGWVVGRQTR